MIDTDRIRRVSPLNTPKASVSPLFLENYVYAFGGEINSAHKPLDEIERYCMTLDVWVILDVALVSPRYDARAIAVSPDYILICGGYGLDRKFVNQIDAVTLLDDAEGISKALPGLLKCSEKVTQFHAYIYKDTICTISGYPITSLEEEKVPFVQAMEPDHLMKLHHYTLEGKLKAEKVLGKAKTGLCQSMPEHDGELYDFYLDFGEKKSGANWSRPRVFDIEKGEEKAPEEFREIMCTISCMQEH